jgi:hypothetical protein
MGSHEVAAAPPFLVANPAVRPCRNFGASKCPLRSGHSDRPIAPCPEQANRDEDQGYGSVTTVELEEPARLRLKSRELKKERGLDAHSASVKTILIARSGRLYSRYASVASHFQPAPNWGDAPGCIDR